MNAAIETIGRRAARALTSHGTARSILRRVSEVGLLPESVWRRLPVDGVFTVSLGAGIEFRYSSNPGDGIGRALYWKGTASWEADTIPVFVELARRSTRFLDIGANTGVYTLLACAVNPSVRVTAFEPVPQVFEILCKNIAVNRWQDRCQTRNEAVSSWVGLTAFHVPQGDVPTSASLHTRGFRGISGRLIDVSVTTVDAVCAEHEAVDLVKIDVEGFEDRVLEGMQRVLANSRPAVILECNPDGPFRVIQGLLGHFGYRFFHLRGGAPVPLADIVPDVTERHRNVLCLPEFRLAWLS